MPRRARRMSDYGYMHVIVRGIGRQILFEDKNDYMHYLRKLEQYCIETNVKVSAYCLMENHVHLLVHGEPEMIILLMKKIGVSYSSYFNKKYDRVGHLFQDRYLSEPIENDVYLLTVFRYILKNPQKAGICSPAHYNWSSYKLYEEESEFLDLSLIQKMLGSKTKYDKFILNSNDDDLCLDYDGNRHDDEWAKEVIAECLGISTGTMLQNYSKAERNSAIIKLKKSGLSARQIERLTGIGRNIVNNIVK